MYQFSAAMSAVSLTISLGVPLFCLFISPGDASAAYFSFLRSSGGFVLPEIHNTFSAVPKILFVLIWLVTVSSQGAVTFLVTPRWWIGLGQLIVAIACAGLFIVWHIALVHMPMIKLFNDLS